MTLNSRYFLGLSRAVRQGALGVGLAAATLVASAQETTLQPYGFVKTPPLKELLNKAAAVATAIKPDPQIASLPVMVGAMMGDPNLASVSAEDDVAVIFFDVPDSPAPFVLMVKLTAESPVRAVATSAGLIVRDSQGWVLLGRDEELLNRVAGLKSIYAIAQKKRSADLEAGVWLGRLGTRADQLQQTILAALLAQPKLQGENAKITVEGLVNLAMTEFKSADSLMLGVNLSAEEIAVQMQLKAKPETPLAAALSGTAGGESAAGRFLAPDGAILAAAVFDPQPIMAYYSHLLQQAVAGSAGRGRAILEKLAELNQRSEGLWGGSSAVSMSLAGDQMEVAQVFAMNGTREEVRSLARDAIAWVKSELLTLIPAEEGVQVEMEYQEAVQEVSGIPLDRLFLKVTAPAETAEELPPPQTYFFAMGDSFGILSTSAEQAGRLIQAVQSGQPVEPNVASRVTLAPGQAVKYLLDLKSLMQIAALEIRKEDPASADLLTQELAALTLEPVQYYGSLGGGKAGFGLSLPVQSIAQLVPVFEKMKEKEAAEEAAELEDLEESSESDDDALSE